MYISNTIQDRKQIMQNTSSRQDKQKSYKIVLSNRNTAFGVTKANYYVIKNCVQFFFVQQHIFLHCYRLQDPFEFVDKIQCKGLKMFYPGGALIATNT